MRHSINTELHMAVRLTKSSVGIIIASLISLWWVGSFFVIYWWVWLKTNQSYAQNWLPLLFIDASVGVLGLAGYAALSARLPE